MAEPVLYVPRRTETPKLMLDAPTAWNGVEQIICDIVERFCPKRELALEFGVQHAYSTVAISNYFDRVIGVDTFLGDPFAGEHPDNYQQTVDSVAPYKNILLCQADWREWAEHRSGIYDLIHVDIMHTYEDTFACGKWSLEHSNCVIFHDTISFPEVCRAVSDLADWSGRTFHHWPYSHGVGILAAEEL